MSKRQSHSTFTCQSEEDFQSTLNTLKDFLIPQIRESQAKRLVDYYTTHFENKIKKREKKINFFRSNSIINEKPIDKYDSILDYSFVTGKIKKNVKPKKVFGKSKKQVEQLQKKIKKVLSQPSLFPRKSKKSIVISTEENIYVRGKDKKNEFNEKMDKLREYKEKNELVNLRKKPEISENSKKIMENKEQLPIYLRVDKIQEDQINHLNNLKKKIQKENNLKNQKSKKRNKTDSNFRFNKWFEMNETWDKIRQAKLNFIKNEVEDIKNYEELLERKEETFHPKISKNSEQILKEKYSNNFQERIQQYHNNKKYCENKIKKEETPSFKPKINKNYKISDAYFERYKNRVLSFSDDILMENKFF